MRLFTLSILILIPFFSIRAQQPFENKDIVHLYGEKRQYVELFPGRNWVRMHGVTPDFKYYFIALPESKEVSSSAVSVSLFDPKLEKAYWTSREEKRHNSRYAVTQDSVLDFVVTVVTPMSEEPLPLLVSGSCVECPRDHSGMFEEMNERMAVLTVQGGIAANSLINNTLIGGNCFDVTGITSAGNAQSRGTFGQGQTSIGINTGVVLCTNQVGMLPGPNNSQGGGFGQQFNNNSADDPDLATIIQGDQWDLSKIEFNFKPTLSNVSFEFVFGSEEYCEFANTQFNDVFGFFISGPGITGNQNLALIPGGTPVTINDVNHVDNTAFYVNNNTWAPCQNLSAAAPNDIQLDGYTTILTAEATGLQPCQTYHLKLAIADVADHQYASAVFLKAGSFDAGGSVKTDIIIPGGGAIIFEDCGQMFIKFTRSGGDINTTVTVNLTIGGTATYGVDWDGLPSPIEIPAGQTFIQIPLNIIADGITEGDETVEITINNACSCAGSMVSFTIKDTPDLLGELEDVTQCGSSSVNLNPNATGGQPPLTYLWSTGSTASNINVNTSGTYTVTITDGCGQTTTAQSVVTMTPPPTANLAGSGVLCEGVPGSFTFNINLGGGGPWTVEINTPNGPQTSTFQTNPGSITVTDPGTYTLTAVENDAGCTGTATGSATITEYDVEVSLNPTDPPCATANNGTITTTPSGGGTPYTYVWSNGATTQNLSGLAGGTYSVVVTDSHGCTEDEEVTLTQPPPIVLSIVSVNNIDCNNPTGSIDLDVSGGSPGFDFNWSNGSNDEDPDVTAAGTYTVTVTDDNGCTKTTTAAVTANLTQPTAVASPMGQINCNTTEVDINGNGSSTGPNFEYEWDGPGIVSGETTLQPTVNAGGTYTLTVTNTDNGCTKTVNVNVVENTTPPNAAASSPGNIGCDTPTLTLSGSGSSTGAGITYSWSTPDGNITGGASTLNPTINQAGTYTILVTNGNNGCTAEESVTVDGNTTPPVADIAPPGQIDCNNPTLDLDGSGSSQGGNFSYNWTASGGGSITGGQGTLNPTAGSGGTYTLVVTDTDNACTATATVSVSANLTQPTAVATSPGPITCTNEEIILNGNGSSVGSEFEYEWDGPGLVSGETTLNPTVNAPGTYTLTVTNTDNGCTKTVNVTVNQNNTPPNAAANTPGSIGCDTPTLTLSGSGSSTGAGITYSWSTPDGNITGGASTLNPTINQAGTYTILVTNNNNGCTAEESVTVEGDTQPPVADIAPPGQIDCNNPTLDLDGSGSSQGGNFSYNWTTSGGGSITGGQGTLNPTAGSGGTYTLVVTNTDNACTATATVSVSADLVKPIAVATAPGLITCQTPEITLNGNGSSVGSNFEYQWDGPGLVSGETTLNPVVNAPGTYTLTVTNTSNGCTKTVSVNVNSNNSIPNAVATSPGEIGCDTPTLTLSGSGSSTGSGITYSWSTNDGNITGGASTLNPTINQAGTYTILVTNNTTGCTAEESVTVGGDTNPPTADIAAPAEINCFNPTIELDGNGSSQGGNFSYNWTATGGGSITGGQGTLNPTIGSGGTYTLVVTNTENACTALATVSVSADLVKPTAVISQPQILDCTNPTITLNGNGSSTGSNFSYEWTTQGGNIVSGETTLNPEVDAPGTYILVVTNTDNGCTKQAQVTVTANQNYPVAQAGPDKTLDCTHPTQTLTGAGSSSGSGFTILWTPPPASGGNTLNPTVNQPGVYTLLVTNNANGCTATDEVEIFENTVLPTPDIADPDEITCYNPTIDLDGSGSVGGDLTFNWTATNGGQIVGPNNDPIITVGAGGTYNLTITDQTNGCTATANVSVVANNQKPTAVAGPGGELDCQNPELTLNGTGSSVGPEFEYEWTTQNGNIVNGENTLNPTVDQAGTYIILVTNTENGCTKQAQVAVTADQALPQADAGDDAMLDCAHFILTLNGGGSSTTPGLVYTWSTFDGNIVSGSNTRFPKVDAPGTYTLLITNPLNGCSAEDEVYVEDNIIYPEALALPAADLDCNNQTITIDAGGSSQGAEFEYDWSSSAGNNSIVSGENSTFPEVNAPGTYTLTVTNTVNHCTATTEVEVFENIEYPDATAAALNQLTCQFPTVELSGAGSSEGPQFVYEWTTTNGHLTSGQNSLDALCNEPGTYILTVLNTENGCLKTASVQVTTNQVFPTANAALPQTIDCDTDTIALNGLGSSTGPQFAYVWFTQNGHIVSGGTTLNPLVDAPGTYDLSVINTQTGCTKTISVTVASDFDQPSVAVAPGGTLSCTVNSLTLSGVGSATGPNFTYLWTTNGGNFISGETTLNPVVNGVGTYTLVVTNSSNGCAASKTTSVNADANLPTAAAGPSDTLDCILKNFTLNANSSSQGSQYSYAWAGPGITAGQGTLTPTVNQPGEYTLTVTNTTNGCKAISSVVIEQDIALPQAEAGATDTLNCVEKTLQLDGSGSSNGLIFNYLWTSPTGNAISGATTLQPSVSQPGTYHLLVSNLKNGCTATDQVEIFQNITPPTVDAGATKQIDCTNPTVSLAGTGSTGQNFRYEWTTANGNIASGHTSLTPVVDAPGTYNLLITNEINGCTATDQVVVTKDANVPLALGVASGEITCAVTSVTLDATASTQGPGITFTWTTANGNFVNGQNTLTPTVDKPGQYVLKIFNSTNNCEAVSTVNVFENKNAPQADAGVPQVVSCTNPLLTLDGNGSSQGPEFSYLWTTQTGHFVSGETTLNPKIDQSGFYKILVTNTLNGCTSEATVQILLDQNTPEADAGPAKTLNCYFSELTLDGSLSSAGPLFNYLWTASGGGNIVSGATSLTPTINQPGTYNLLVSNPSNGCTAAATVIVTKDIQPPVASIAVPPTLDCQLTAFDLNASSSSTGGIFSYTWTATAGGNIVSGGTTISPEIDAPGTYNLLIINTENGCTNSTSTTVKEDVNLPTAEAGPTDVLSCTHTQATLAGTMGNAGSNFSITWSSPDGGVFVSGQNTLTPVISAAATYILTVENLINHCKSTDQVVITQDASLPVAQANAAPLLTCAVLEVELSGVGSSTGIDFSYLWSGPGLVSGETTLKPTVNAPGTYILTVFNTVNNCKTITSVVVPQDIQPPLADAGAAVTLTCSDASVKLDGTGSATGSQYSYLWTTANGVFWTGTTTLTPTVTSPGIYQIEVTDKNNGCTASSEVEVLQDLNAPTSVATAPGELTCKITSLTLSGAGSSTGQQFDYQWITANGNIVSGGTTLAPTVDEPGLYKLQITNKDNGCSTTASVTVTENRIAPVADAGPLGFITCVVKQFALTGSGSGGSQGVSYAWSTANGVIVSGQSTATPEVSSPGIYTLIVSDLYNGCTDSDETQVLPDASIPVAAIANPQTLTCALPSLQLDATGSDKGNDFKYDWTTPNGNLTGGQTSLTPTIDAPGTYQLLVTNIVTGCTQTASISVNEDVEYPLAEAGTGFEITCVVLEKRLDGNGTSTGQLFVYQWNTPDGNILVGGNSLQPLVNEPGMYRLVVTNTRNGCTDEDHVEVTKIQTFPTGLDLDLDPPACGGQRGEIIVEMVIGGEGPYSYSLDGGKNFGASPDFKNLKPGTYHLVIQDVNGCKIAETVVFDVPVEPTIEVSPDVTIEFGDSTKLMAEINIPLSEVDSVVWSPKEYVWLTTNPLEVFVKPFTNQQFTVTVFNEDGCEDKALVNVRVGDPAIWVPNVFKPSDSDGDNDRFLIFAKPGIVLRINTLQIYDRWGEQVFQAIDFLPNDRQYGWAGNFDGKLMNPGVYVYWAEVTLLDGSKIFLKGDVTLVD